MADLLAPVAFGSALSGAAALTAAAVRASQREKVLAALGSIRPSSESGRRSTGTGFMAARARRDGWRYGSLSYGTLLLFGGLAGFLAGGHLLGTVGALAGLVAAPVTVRAVLRRRTTRMADLLDEQFRETVMALAGAVRAGLSVRRALEEVTREVEQPLRGHLENTLARLRVGEPLESALAWMAENLGLPDASLLVTLLALHRRSGGDLPGMLDELGHLVGLRRDARRDLRALTAQGRASGAVLAVLPIAFVTLLSWTGGDGLGDFYRTPTGALLLVAGLACDALGFLWIRRIVRPRGYG